MAARTPGRTAARTTTPTARRVCLHRLDKAIGGGEVTPGCSRTVIRQGCVCASTVQEGLFTATSTTLRCFVDAVTCVVGMNRQDAWWMMIGTGAHIASSLEVPFIASNEL